MPRYTPLRLSYDLRAWHFEELCRLLASLKSLGEMREVLHDLLFPAEIVMFARRFRIASMLIAGTDHRAICKEIGAGTSTIQSISRRLSRGGNGYAVALKRIAGIRKEIEDEVERAVASLPHDSPERTRRLSASARMTDYLLEDVPRDLKYAAAGRRRRASMRGAGRGK